MRPSLILRVVAIVVVVGLIVLLARSAGLTGALGTDRIEQLLAKAGPLAPLVFMGMMALTIVVSPIPSVALDILAGRLFGPLLGTFYAAVGALLGAVMSFWIARLLGRELLARFLKGHINFCQECSDMLLTKLVFLTRLIPFVSFDLVSYGAGLTKMSLLRFSLATFVGMLPLTFVYTSFGAVVLENPAVTWIGAAMMVALFFLLPRWIERHDLFSLRRLFPHLQEPGARDQSRTD